MFNKKIRHIHFVGIGGSGMSGLAEVLLNNYRISGSDISESEAVKHLRKLGAKIYIGHSAENIRGADMAVYSSAISQDNPEFMAAMVARIPVIPRAAMLAELMRMKFGIAIAGTHGKTTTSSMAALVLTQAGLDPTIVLGGRLKVLGSNAKLGQGKYLVAESDESDGSFLRLCPKIAIITNIDNDHLDYYGSMDRLKDAFVTFANQVPLDGCVIVCRDDENLRSIIPRIYKTCITYGLSADAEIRAEKIRFSGFGSEFEVVAAGKRVGRLRLEAPGWHNIRNALAVVALCMELKIKFSDIAKAFALFQGSQRRFEIISCKKGVLVIDDYGHHPTEIKATLETAREIMGRSKKWKRLRCIFQPHRYTRTKILGEKFTEAFISADEVIVTDIYSAGEKPIEGVTSELIVAHMKNGKIIPDKERSLVYILRTLRPGDVIVIQGAGDIQKIGQELADKIKS